MTRATLLHFLDQPTAIAPEDVRELEQLAQAFPYCQTAHLLLAKAAHDQGTMLAGQRLRRAATYAADRALLRRLIEQVAPEAIGSEALAQRDTVEAPSLVEVPPPPRAEAAAEPLAPTTPTQPPVIVEPAVVVEALPSLTTAPAPAPVAPIPVVAAIEAVVSLVAEPVLPTQEATISEAIALDSSAEAAEIEARPVSKSSFALPAPQRFTASFKRESGPAPAPALLPISEPVESVASVLVAVPSVPAPPPATEVSIVEVPVVIAALPVLIPEVEEELPAQAPAIRPSEEAGEARFEFGLNEAASPLVIPTYELPGLADELAVAAPPMLAPPILKPATSPLPPPPDVSLTPTAFTGDQELGYAFGESSRLGFSMQLLNQLYSLDLKPATATTLAIPVAALPPTNAFFAPDALLLEYWATHCPPPVILPSSLDLINNFLRRQPRLTRPAMLPPNAGTQSDLSVRSTRPETDLASESLALIFARQGKTARAIEIYEQLMVKQPEKMAYFTAQIQQLQPSA